MPITRRKRANPPDQPENNNHQPSDQPENSSEAPTTEQPASVSTETEPTVNAATPEHAENISAPPATPPSVQSLAPATLPFATNGERGERTERQEYNSIESGRRTARGELFRRPPQPPPSLPPVVAPPLQAPSHEIKLPLGKEFGDSFGDPLHLAYNPGYTGADEARSALLHKLEHESKAGGRARCWNCGSLAIVYDRWSTRSKTFGDVGVAFCEICGVWSVM